jgi:hypothetical protein
MNENQKLDWLTTVGSEFERALLVLVNPDFLDPHEATEPLFNVLGMDFTPEDLRDLSDETESQLVTEFNRYFESDTITSSLVKESIAAILRRW